MADDQVAYITADIWRTLMSRIPVRYIYNVRAVCRSWNYAITDIFAAAPANVNSLPGKLLIPANPSAPRGYLLMSQFLPSRSLFMAEFLVTRDHPKARPRAKLDKFDLRFEFGPVASCNGLVLLAASRKVNLDWYMDPNLNPIIYCVSNPIKGQYSKRLPFPMDIMGRASSLSSLISSKRHFCGFGFCPSSGEYKVIQFHYQYGESTEVEIHTLGTCTWRKTNLIPPDQLESQARTARCIGTYLNGALYWMVVEGANVFMHCFDLANETFRSIDVQEFNAREGSKFLGSTGSHLYISVHLNGVLDVFLTNDLDSWAKVLSIRIPRRTGTIELIKYADDTHITILCSDNVDESTNFCLMAWDPKVHKGNILGFELLGVEYIQSSYRPVAYLPNFTSLSDAVPGYQMRYGLLSGRNRPS